MQVFSHGSFAGEHPVNRKAKCKVYLRDLQEQTGLTDEALQLIARVCGPRWDYNIYIIAPVSTTGLLAYVVVLPVIATS